MKKAVTTIQTALSALRAERERTGLDRYEAVESVHQSTSAWKPALPAEVVEAVGRLGLAVNIYSLDEAASDLRRLAAEGNPQAAGLLPLVEAARERRRRLPAPSELERYLRRLPLGRVARVTERQLRFALGRLAAYRRFLPRRKTVREAGGTYGRPPAAARLRELVWAVGLTVGVAEALARGHRDVDELEAAGVAAARELGRFDPRRARPDADVLLWARRAAARAAARARIKRVSGLSVPQRQMPLVGKLREQLARGVRDPESLAAAAGLDLDTVEALLPAAEATGALEEGLTASEASVEETYEEQLLREAVRDALDGLVGIERFAIEAYMVYGQGLAELWPDLLKGKVGAEHGLTPPPEAPAALEELRELYRRMRKGLGARPHPEDQRALALRAARMHAGRYWKAAAAHLKGELAPFAEG